MKIIKDTEKDSKGESEIRIFEENEFVTCLYH